MSSIIELSEDQESLCLTTIYEQVKKDLDQLEPRLAAEMIFGNYIKQETQSPQFWQESFGNSYKKFPCDSTCSLEPTPSSAAS